MSDAAEKYPDLLMFVRADEYGEWWIPVVQAQLDAINPEITIDGSGAVRSYTKLRRTLRAYPGDVFLVRLEEGSVSYTKNAKSVATWPNPKQRAEWIAYTRAAEHAQKAAKALDKESKRRFDLERLDPLKRAYHRASGAARAQLLAEVVAYIVK